MSALHIITSEGEDMVATIELGQHGGPCLVIREESRPPGAQHGRLFLGVKAEHASDALLAHYFDPGTVSTVLDYVAAGE